MVSLRLLTGSFRAAAKAKLPANGLGRWYAMLCCLLLASYCSLVCISSAWLFGAWLVGWLVRGLVGACVVGWLPAAWLFMR